MQCSYSKIVDLSLLTGSLSVLAKTFRSHRREYYGCKIVIDYKAAFRLNFPFSMLRHTIIFTISYMEVFHKFTVIGIIAESTLNLYTTPEWSGIEHYHCYKLWLPYCVVLAPCFFIIKAWKWTEKNMSWSLLKIKHGFVNLIVVFHFYYMSNHLSCYCKPVPQLKKQNYLFILLS